MEKIDSNLQFKENPRKISNVQFDQLSNNLLKFGDLGGVVYCRNNKSYIGGNQRSKIFDGAKIEIIQSFDTPQADKTIAFGFINWNGNKYLYREVEFTEDEFHEACITANSLGGDWDYEALLSGNWDIEALKNWGVDLSDFTEEFGSAELSDLPENSFRDNINSQDFVQYTFLFKKSEKQTIDNYIKEYSKEVLKQKIIELCLNVEAKY